MTIFAYLIDDEMVCPNCAKDKPGAKECHNKDYSFGYEIIGCNWCNQTLTIKAGV